jgi:malate dehydrogenase
LQSFVESGIISSQKLDAIRQRTRDGGAEIVNLLGNGSAFYSPAASAFEMAISFLHDKKAVLPCAAMLHGEYGFSNVYAGVPCVIGSNGVERVIDIPLLAHEKDMFQKSVESVMALIKIVDATKIA